jgi:hypothetical protein
MCQPEGFVKRAMIESCICSSLSLYGLKQAGHCWHFQLNEELEKMRFKRIVCEHSIWIYMKDNVHIIVLVFIDDMTIASKSKEAIKSVKREYKQCFKLCNLGLTSWLLGNH